MINPLNDTENIAPKPPAIPPSIYILEKVNMVPRMSMNTGKILNWNFS